MAVELSYCVVNTDGRELLLRCLDAIAAEQATLDFATEVLVLDNASGDGSAGAARQPSRDDEVIALERAAARARTTPSCCSARAGGCCLLLNEDSELLPGATRGAARGARRAPAARGAAGARLLRPDGAPAAVGVALSDAR